MEQDYGKIMVFNNFEEASLNLVRLEEKNTENDGKQTRRRDA